VTLGSFETIGDAANSVIEMMQKEMHIGMVELLDTLMMKVLQLTNNLHKSAILTSIIYKAINIRFKFSYPEKPTLYLGMTS